MQTWLLYALLSAVFAAFVGIFGKLGMTHVDSSLATTIRSIVMTVFLITVSVVTGVATKITTIDLRSGWMILLSGIAGAISWLFYFKALQLSEVSKVAPIDKLSLPLAVVLSVILLGDKPSGANWFGILLIVGGGYLAALPNR